MKAKEKQTENVSVNKLMVNAKVCRKTLEARLSAGWPTDYAVNLPAYTVLLNDKPVAMSDVAKDLGITRRKLAEELNGVLHADEVVNRLAAEHGTRKRGKHTPRPRKAIEYEGRTWTIAELARHAGIKYITMSMRLRKGWPVEKAVGAPLREWPKYMYKGRELTVAEISDETGVDRGLLSARIARGLGVDEAVNMSVGGDNAQAEPTRTTRVVQDENGEWVTVGELARRAGISYAVLTRRLFRDKLPLAKAIAMPERKRTTYIVDGEKVSVAEVAKRINHCTGTVYLHLREGLTMQEIVDKYTKQQESSAE